MDKDRSARFAFRNNFWPILLIAFSLAAHIWWIKYTNYTEEDAFVTFRFAKQISMGNGFVYNIGQRIYGTTTPLFTLLLAGWMHFVSKDIVLGARILNIIAVSAALIFTWQTFHVTQRSASEKFFALSACLLSANLIYMNTQGMETPFGIALIAASWYAWTRNKIYLTGILCGLLLWTRVDLVFWMVTLIAVTAISNVKDSLRIAAIAGIVYFPWIIFATIYFGSPIPYAITSKWVEFGQFNDTPYGPQVITIVKYLSPFKNEAMRLIGGGLVLSVMTWAIWKNNLIRDKRFLPLIIFFLLEVLRLVATRATYFSRYFIPVLWVTLIFLGMGLGLLWECIKTTRVSKIIFSGSLILLLILELATGIAFADSVKERQFFRHESALKGIGLWLRDNTELQSVVLLEPLGYVGYYSDRIMIDEVGLVTPAVVALKLRQIGPEKYASIFEPDYVVVHCDDYSRMPIKPQVKLNYQLAIVFDPLGFKSPDPDYLPRASCYQIWKKER